MNESRPDLKELTARLNLLLERTADILDPVKVNITQTVGGVAGPEALARLVAKSPQAVTGDRIGLQVLQALGLPTQGVTSFSISFAPNEIVIATVKSVVDKQRLEQVCETYLTQLKVGAPVSEPESAPPETDAPVPFDRPMR